jgi:WD40 repeat protein
MVVSELARAAHSLLKDALDREGEDRASFLDESCQGQPELRREVDSLLTALGRAGTFLERPALGWREPTRTSESFVGERIGGFELVGVLGEGGMGVVYRAEQADPRRIVALKIMHAAVGSREAMRRFRYESQVLARLQHPNVAQVYETGTYDDGSGGVPWFAMEYVPEARTLTDHAADLDLDDRLSLFRQVCAAVHYGHQQGIIHRDLKPANILVDPGGRPRVIDFGIARATDCDVAITTVGTDVGRIIGTVQYMSPEQLDADPALIDTRSDVYALGLILFELTCGRRPYELKATNLFEAARLIRDQPPVRPRLVRGDVPADVETIILKALEKDRDRRYQSVEAMSDDVLRFLRHEPIAARRPSVRYRMGRFVRRHTAACVSGAAAVAILIAATIVSVSLAIRTARQRDEAVWREYTACLAASDAAFHAGESGTAVRRLDGAPAAHRGWAWRHMRARIDSSERVLQGHTELVYAAVFIDDSTIVSGGTDRTVRWWDVETGRVTRTVSFDDRVLQLTVSDDGSTIAVAAEQRLHVLAADGTTIASRTLDARINDLAFDPTGTRLALALQDSSIEVVEVGTASRNLTLAGHDQRVGEVEFSSDGAAIASVGANMLRIWDAGSGAPIGEPMPHAGDALTLAWHPGRNEVAVGTGDGTVVIWDIEAGTRQRILNGHQRPLSALAFTPDGTTLVSGGQDERIVVWDPESGRQRRVLRGHRSYIMHLECAPNGTSLVSASADRSIRTWSLDADPALIHIGHELNDVAFTHDGRLLVSTRTGAVQIRDPDRGTLLKTIEDRSMMRMATDPRGFVYVAGTAAVRTWRLDDGSSQPSLDRHTGRVLDIDIDPDLRLLATSARDDTIVLWDLSSKTEPTLLAGHENDVTCVRLGSDGARLVSSSWDSTVRVWTLPAGGSPLVIEHPTPVEAVAAHPLEDLVASGARDGLVRVWHAGSGDLLQTMEGHSGIVLDLLFSDDGRLLFSGATDGTVRIWDVATATELLTLVGGSAAHALAMSPDGSRLASLDGESVRIWDTELARDRLAGRQR